MFHDAIAALPPRPVSFLLYFVTGRDDLTDASKLELGRMLEELRRREVADIVVIGHTDRVGNEQANDELSLARAERVKAEFVAQGIASAERIRAAGPAPTEALLVFDPRRVGLERRRAGRQRGEQPLQPLVAVELAALVHRLGDPVGERAEHVAAGEAHRLRGERERARHAD